jgi:fatty-acyl-CoA synthase
LNLGIALEHWARQRPDHCAIEARCGAQTTDQLSYAQLWQAIGAAQTWLVEAGYQRGDRLAWLGWNHPGMLVLLFAAARLGMALVPLNFRLTAHELTHPLTDAQPRGLWVDTALEPCASLIDLEGLGIARVDASAWWHQIRQQANQRTEVPAASGGGSLEDDLLIVYTSGTTGKPKGAVLTQKALWFNSLNSMHVHDLSSADRILMALPIFHVGGLNIMLVPGLLCGASTILMDRFEAGAFLATMAQCRPTLTVLVPAVIRALIMHPNWPDSDWSSYRMVNAGSSIIPVELIQAIHEKGVPLGQVYGSTETAPIAICLRAEDALRKIGSTGLPAPYCEARLVHQAEVITAPSIVGEIQVRGPNVMDRYLNAPQATQQAFDQGWYRTGDLAYRDSEGYWWVVGRSRDLIISGGENVYPAEVESLLEQHPAIAEVAVVGLSDARWGEVVVAAIVSKPDGPSVSLEQCEEFLRERLARYKQPRAVFACESLPKTALGKVQKAELIALLEQRRVVDGSAR